MESCLRCTAGYYEVLGENELTSCEPRTGKTKVNFYVSPFNSKLLDEEKLAFGSLQGFSIKNPLY